MKHVGHRIVSFLDCVCCLAVFLAVCPCLGNCNDVVMMYVLLEGFLMLNYDVVKLLWLEDVICWRRPPWEVG